VVVEVGGAVHRVYYKQYNVGLFNGQFHLAIDFSLKDVVGVYHPSAGVDDREFHAVPVYFAILAIASGAGSGVDDCSAALGKAIEKG
jgi:hypothetical protein